MRSPWFLWLCLHLLYSLTASASITFDLTKNWRFSPDQDDVGLMEAWFREDFDDNSWAVLQAGSKWEEQGFTELDGTAWYRRWVEVPTEWKGSPIWLVFGGINDEYVLFVNGVRIQSYGHPLDNSTANSPTATEVSSFLRYGGRNLIAVRVVDWIGSGGLQRLPCCLTNDTSQLPSLFPVSLAIDSSRQLVLARWDLTTLGNERNKERVEISFHSQGRDSIDSTTQTVEMAGRLAGEATYEIALPADACTFELRVKVSEGDQIYHQTRQLRWMGNPTWLEHPELQVLNNFVTVLANQEITPPATTELSFLNPRQGWVFLSLSSQNKGDTIHRVNAYLDDATMPLVLRLSPGTGDLEAMQSLPMGPHLLRVSTNMPLQVQVRAIPELAYTYYPCAPHLAVQGSFAWKYLERYVLPHVNTLVTGGGVQEEILDQWWREGRKWVVNSSLVGAEGPVPDPSEVLKVWESSATLFDPRISGIIVDEFITAGPERYRVWREAYQRLTADARFHDKTFYAFSGDLYEMTDTESRAFCQALIDRGDLFAVEKYLPEEPTLQMAEDRLLSTFQGSLNTWKSLYPNFEKHLIYCLGILSAPPETLNTNPALDLKVYMDMQFNLLANDPTCWGIAGIMEYSSSYADEEILRWAYRLYRHYAIEGYRERLTQDPYHLTHLVNPDFDKGTEGWSIQSAEGESVHPGEMKGFSWLQGRYPRTQQGDHYLVFKRSETTPNRAVQTIRNLEPGRVYSLKLLAAGLQHLDQKQDLALGIEIGNVDHMDHLTLHAVYPSSYSHTLGEYNKDHPAFFNYYRIVFRARSQTAELTLSDWMSPENPGGPAGQETAVNYVEVQPFLEP